MRNIFVLIDGTGCHAGTNTNISKIGSIAKNAGYEKVYKPGPGAISNTRLRDEVFAPNVEPMALEIYQSISDLSLTFEDRLYIVGYSRGAVVARTLAMCIASTENLRKAARKSAIYGSIPAQIELLCLFDPVIGKPRLSRSSVNNHEAVFDRRVRTYVELLSLDEPRLYFPSDSYFASKMVRKKMSIETSGREAKSTQDRKGVLHDLNLRKTRRSIWFPGNHSDVGGYGGNQLIGDHSLATALEELLLVAGESEIPMSFQEGDVKNLIVKIVSPIDQQVMKEANKSIFRQFWKKLGNRKPENTSVVQHFAHATCAQMNKSADFNQELATYPDYTKLLEQICGSRAPESE